MKKYQNFIKKYLPQDFAITPIKGDAGLRSYFRIKIGVESYILMDCPLEYCSIIPFVEMASYLRSNGFLAPQIIAYDSNEGLMILEDFGDVNIKNLIQNTPSNERKNIYHKMLDIIVSLQQKTPPKNLRIFDNKLLLSELSVFTDYYVPMVLKRKLDESELKEYEDIWQEILEKQINIENSIVLRDYHVENIMYVNKSLELGDFGLLDFQDALIGSPIYDLVSVLEDARIEVPRDLAMDCIEYFAQQKNLAISDVLINYSILGAQRNSRILGVFARKFLRDKNDSYLKYIPLVQKYLKYDLSHPIMSKLKNWHENRFTKN